MKASGFLKKIKENLQVISQDISWDFASSQINPLEISSYTKNSV
jgi:hypothetical protein